MNFYEGNDTNKWVVQFDEPNFKQSSCFQDDRPVIMMKVRTTLKCPLKAILDITLNFDTRMSWDKNVVDFKILEMNPDMCGRLYHRFLSPTPAIVSHRDFYVLQLVKQDFPEKGNFCAFTKSLPSHPECPETKDNVRGNIYISAFVFKPIINEHGEEHTELFMLT